jgi:prolyl oligopeptidase
MKSGFLALALASATLASHAADTTDPHLWLENVTDPKALDWAKAHNATTRTLLESQPGFAQLRGNILAALDSKAKIPGINKMGEQFYNFWRDADHPRGLWRRTTLDEYRKTEPTWETVLDLDALAKAENENWVFKGAECRYPAYDRCLISLSRGGADAVVVREFDIASKTFVKGGFSLPEAKSEVSWQGKNAIFVGTDFGKGSLTDSGYPRVIKLWQRGTPLAAAHTVFSGKQTDVSVNASVYERAGYRHELIYRGVTFYTNETWLREGGKLRRMAVPDDVQVGFFGPQLLLTLRKDWKIGDKTWPAGSLLATDFKAFQVGKRQFTALFTPSATTALEGTSATQHYLLVTTLDKVKGRVTEWRFDGGTWQQREVDVPKFGSLNASGIDDDTTDDYFFSQTDFLTPSSLYLAHAGSDQRELLKQNPSFFNASGLSIDQLEATSKDGTKVPYFIVKPANLALDGNNPTLLYGYGGFEVSMLPRYSAAVGKGWLAQGGVYVLANIRGGGEFGPTWHDAALKDKRQNAYDDFIAVAEDLIARKITQPKKLGIMGGSNGGLLMGVMMTERPDLFGAVVCQVPLLDMRRYNQLLAGASWMGEYGNPDIPEEWAYIQRYSPYHNIKPNTAYPNILFTTSTRDDRVHPGHARKMMARMEEMGVKSVWYYENIEGGHAGAADNKQSADMAALEYTFLWKMLK